MMTVIRVADVIKTLSSSKISVVRLDRLQNLEVRSCGLLGFAALW